MKSSLQTPQPLRKSRSSGNHTPTISSVPSHFKTSDPGVHNAPRHQKIRPKSLDTDFLTASEHILSDPADPVIISGENCTLAISSVPSHFKTSDLSVHDYPRHQKIRPKSPDTDFLTASEHILSDPADPVMISSESGSNLFIFTESSDLSFSNITMEQKLASSSTCLAESEHNLSAWPNLAMSSASSCTSQYSAQKQISLGQNAHSENLNEGKYGEVISALDLIKKAFSEINGSKDFSDGTKKIMGAMFEAAVHHLEGGEAGMRTVKLVDSSESSSNIFVLSNSSNLSLSNITVEEKLLSKSKYLAGSEHILSDVPHLVISPASSCTSECSAQKQLLLETEAPGTMLNKGTYEDVTSVSDLIRKALSDINHSKDIANETKKIMDAMFEAVVQQLEREENGLKTVRSAGSVLMANLCTALLLLVILIFAVRLLLKFWPVDGQDWPYGLTPT